MTASQNSFYMKYIWNLSLFIQFKMVNNILFWTCRKRLSLLSKFYPSDVLEEISSWYAWRSTYLRCLTICPSDVIKDLPIQCAWRPTLLMCLSSDVHIWMLIADDWCQEILLFSISFLNEIKLLINMLIGNKPKILFAKPKVKVKLIVVLWTVVLYAFRFSPF
jgi:hypothetical protein